MPGFHTKKRVEFADTDMAGIMHFSRFFAWMEECEHELLRDVGLSVMMPNKEHVISWPRVSAHCDYRSPIRFEDEVDLIATVGNVGNKSVRYDFDFTHQSENVAQGHLIAVCCQVTNDRRVQAITIPEEIRTQLSKYVG